MVHIFEWADHGKIPGPLFCSSPPLTPGQITYTTKRAKATVSIFGREANKNSMRKFHKNNINATYTG